MFSIFQVRECKWNAYLQTHCHGENGNAVHTKSQADRLGSLVTVGTRSACHQFTPLTSFCSNFSYLPTSLPKNLPKNFEIEICIQFVFTNYLPTSLNTNCQQI